MNNLVEGGHGFFNFFKGGHLQKRLENPNLNQGKLFVNVTLSTLHLLFLRVNQTKETL